jgi:hypothetical protein
MTLQLLYQCLEQGRLFWFKVSFNGFHYGPSSANGGQCQEMKMGSVVIAGLQARPQAHYGP